MARNMNHGSCAPPRGQVGSPFCGPFGSLCTSRSLPVFHPCLQYHKGSQKRDPIDLGPILRPLHGVARNFNVCWQLQPWRCWIPEEAGHTPEKPRMKPAL